MLVIDGSEGEGGGQILRTSLALSLITGTPIRLHRIRAGRPKPGLRLQHRACVLAAARIGNARCNGAEVGSQEIVFEPGVVNGGVFTIDIGSAGSTSLVLQSVLPALFFANEKTRLEVIGGTHNPMAPTADFLELAFFDQLRRMGLKIAYRVERRGFFPQGGGRVVLEVEPGRPQPRELLELEKPGDISGECLVQNLPAHIAERERRELARGLKISERSIELTQVEDAPSAGNVVTLRLPHAEGCEIVSELGAQGVPAETVARRAIRRAKAHLRLGVPVGEHLADQLLVPWALAGSGAFRTGPLSLHARTNIAVIERFLPLRFHLEEDDAVTVRVRSDPS